MATITLPTRLLEIMSHNEEVRSQIINLPKNLDLTHWVDDEGELCNITVFIHEDGYKIRAIYVMDHNLTSVEAENIAKQTPAYVHYIERNYLLILYFYSQDIKE